MLIEDLIKAIEDYLEVTPEKCKETTSPPGEVKKSYRAPWLAKNPQRMAHETQQAFSFRVFFSLLIRRGMRLMGQQEVSTPDELQEALA